MIKIQQKAPKTQKIPLNHNSNTPMEYYFSKKSRQEINREYYQKNKEERQKQRREKYQQQKLQAELSAQQQSAKYYEAEAINILISLKEYTELNKEKKQLWLDFNWTLKDCREAFQKGFGNVVAVMKLAQVAERLIKDYWTTAKSEKHQKSKSWNVLSQEEQDRLIKYWAREKVRIENGYLEEWERLERQSQEYLKEIELAKFHEERGKIKCSCYDCENRKEIQKEVKKELENYKDEYDRQIKTNKKQKCPSCGKLRVLDEETDVCKDCSEGYE